MCPEQKSGKTHLPSPPSLLAVPWRNLGKGSVGAPGLEPFWRGRKQRTLGTSGGNGSKTPGKGLDGELCNGDLESTAQTGGIQNFAEGPGQVGIPEGRVSGPDCTTVELEQGPVPSGCLPRSRGWAQVTSKAFQLEPGGPRLSQRPASPAALSQLRRGRDALGVRALIIHAVAARIRNTNAAAKRGRAGRECPGPAAGLRCTRPPPCGQSTHCRLRCPCLWDWGRG